MATNRGALSAVEAANRYAVARGLMPDERMALVRKTEATLEWLKGLRRAAEIARRHARDQVQRHTAVRELTQATAAWHREYGPLEFRLRPGHMTTAEGFPLPQDADPDLGGYTLYPLFRDGIVRLVIHEGVRPDDMDAILDVIAARGRFDGDDAFTRLWLTRGPHIAIEVEPTLWADIAVSLAAQGDDDLAVTAFLATLAAAGPFFSTSDARSAFTADRLDALADQGVDVAAARRMLLEPDGDALLPAITPAGAATLRALLAQEGDLHARIVAAQGRHAPGGTP